MVFPITKKRRPNNNCTVVDSIIKGMVFGSKERVASTFGLALLVVLSLLVQKDATGEVKTDFRSLAKPFSPWTLGILDIHHLQVGSSVSTFVVMPDATTMLIDAGDLNVPYTLSELSRQGPPLDTLNVKAPFPDESKTPIGWIIAYMQDFWPLQDSRNKKTIELDYLLLTHFHSDHFGDGNTGLWNRSKSSSGNYVLSGIPELASRVGVKKIIDRGFPSYNDPVDLRSLNDKSMNNYLQFVKENKAAIIFEKFQVGSSEQIQMMKGNGGKERGLDFRIRIIKSSQQVAAPKGEPVPVHEIPGGDALKENLHGMENTMSAAIVVEYGGFRYYEGADQEVIRNSNGDIIYDTIGPTAKAAGLVDVATLNHHGHGVSQDYINHTDPRFMILQGWASDQPPKKSMEMLAALPVPPRIFATDIFRERLDGLGPSLSKMFQSTSGHVVIRVYPPPAKTANLLRGNGNDNPERQTFEIMVLDGRRQIKARHGPFPVRSAP